MVQYCCLVFIKTVYFTTIKTTITMKGLILFRRTTKSEETIKLRFRLRNVHGVELYHKSEIKANIKTGKSGYNVKIRKLLEYCQIDREVKVSEKDSSDNIYKPFYTMGVANCVAKSVWTCGLKYKLITRL